MEEDKADTGKKRKGISRRGFIKLVGAGALATTVGDAVKPGGAAAAAAPAEVTEPGETIRITLRVNGRRHRVKVEPRWSLLEVLREKLGLTGPKLGCGRGPPGLHRIADRRSQSPGAHELDESAPRYPFSLLPCVCLILFHDLLS